MVNAFNKTHPPHPVVGDYLIICTVRYVVTDRADFLHLSEKVRHGHVTIGVKCVWSVITGDQYSFYHLRGAFYNHFYLRSAQAHILWMLSKCKVQAQIRK